MDFSTMKAWVIPEGNVIKVRQIDGKVIWQKPSEGRIPSEYQEVAWIRVNSGEGAYIDLGFVFDTKARIYLSQWIFAISSVTYPFGAAESSGKLRCLLSSPYSNNAVFYGSNLEGYISSQVAFFSEDIADGYKHEFYMHLEKGDMYIKNERSGATGNVRADQGVYTMTNNLYLFAQNYNGSPRFGGTRQIGYFKYYDKNDELICDLVPCYRKNDNVSGMYDLVRKIFLTNVGSGDFILGPIAGSAEDDTEYEFVDIISTAIDDNGEIYNGTGYKDGVRWSSSGGGEVSYPNGRISGWIPCEPGMTYRFKNFYMEAGYVSGAYVVYKKADGSIAVQATGLSQPAPGYGVDASADTCTFITNVLGTKYFRVSGYSGSKPPIIEKMVKVSKE